MFLDDYTCVMCSQGCEETSLHLFFWMQLQQRMLGNHSHLLGPQPQSYGHDFTSTITLW